MPARRQKVHGREDPCCPRQQGNSISWPCRLLPVLLSGPESLALPESLQTRRLPGELGQLRLGSGVGIRREWP